MDTLVLQSFMPECFLSVSILAQLIFNIKLVKTPGNNNPIITREVFSQTVFILVCLLFLLLNLKIEGALSNFLLVNDESTRCMKILIVIVSLFTINIVFQGFTIQNINFFEFFTLFLLSLLASFILLSAHDLIVFYLAVEMQSLCFYILASIKRDSSFSTEAGLKYFISGAYISCFFLIGCTLLYGSLGTLNLHDITLLFSSSVTSYSLELDTNVLIGIACVTSAILFKIACAPFHSWAPDVYEGAPLSSTIIFSIVPKLSLIYFFIKWVSALNHYVYLIHNSLVYCGLLSIVLGAFMAVGQKRLKRLVIYSSISQIGFIVCGLSIDTLSSNSAVLFFLIIYLISNILLWGHISVLYSSSYLINKFNNTTFRPLFISSLSNFNYSNRVWALSLLIIFFSIAGIPPLIGFFSKVAILLELVSIGHLVPATLAAIVSSISVFYYIRMVKIIYFEPKEGEKRPKDFQIIYNGVHLDQIYFIFAFLLFLLVVIFLYPTSLRLFCDYLVLNMKGF